MVRPDFCALLSLHPLYCKGLRNAPRFLEQMGA